MAARERSGELRFSKFQALGNDFIVIDLREGAEPIPSPQAPQVARALCDRRRGIGADGVLLVLPPQGSDADARMRTINADGSEAGMCGNGLRCVVASLAEVENGHKDALKIETGAGVLSCEVERAGDHVGLVTVDMGPPGLLHPEIPMEGPEHQRCVGAVLDVDGREHTITAVSVGNPHAVAFYEGDASLRAEAEALGPLVERHGRFPERVNAGFAIMGSKLDLVVWERGVGLTPACGTGACAAVVAACLTGRASPGEEIAVRQEGGELGVAVDPQYASVRMRGEAHHVFDGHIDLAALSTS